MLSFLLNHRYLINFRFSIVQIFESKGEMGMFCNMKKQVTIPQEFNFAIDKRIPPPTSVVDLFDKVGAEHVFRSLFC